MDTPVALIIFNRPDTTKRVFEQVAKAKPRRLFIIADGPRGDRPGEREKCAAVRTIVEGVSWDCEVFKNYSDVNLGCGRGPAAAITWVFEHVEEAIILEDDCLPDQSFFRFCHELLEKYRHDERVMSISGTKIASDSTRLPYSYFFSRLPKGWGWATWRRAWEHFDFDLNLWPELRDTSWLGQILEDPSAVGSWSHVFDRVLASDETVDYWDHQWTFASWVQNGLAVVPQTNLVSNIGFGEDGTHTKNPTGFGACLPTAEIRFPLRHPPYIEPYAEADRYLIERVAKVWRQKQRRKRLIWRLRRKLAHISRGLHKMNP